MLLLAVVVVVASILSAVVVVDGSGCGSCLVAVVMAVASFFCGCYC